MTEILLALKSALELAQFIGGVIEKAHAESRDPTPDEIAAVKAKQKDAENRWASLAPQSDNAAEGGSDEQPES